MLNKVILQGRLVNDPELKNTPAGVPVATFRIAVDRDFKGKDGEKETDFVSIVAWRSTGENAARFFSKGRMAIVEGRLQMRNYTDRDGNKRTAAEVVAEHIYFGDSPRQGGGESSGGGYSVPAPSYGGGYSAPANNSGFTELDEDDGELPF